MMEVHSWDGGDDDGRLEEVVDGQGGAQDDVLARARALVQGAQHAADAVNATANTLGSSKQGLETNGKESPSESQFNGTGPVTAMDKKRLEAAWYAHDAFLDYRRKDGGTTATTGNTGNGGNAGHGRDGGGQQSGGLVLRTMASSMDQSDSVYSGGDTPRGDAAGLAPQHSQQSQQAPRQGERFARGFSTISREDDEFNYDDEGGGNEGGAEGDGNGAARPEPLMFDPHRSDSPPSMSASTRRPVVASPRVGAGVGGGGAGKDGGGEGGKDGAAGGVRGRDLPSWQRAAGNDEDIGNDDGDQEGFVPTAGSGDGGEDSAGIGGRVISRRPGGFGGAVGGRGATVGSTEGGSGAAGQTSYSKEIGDEGSWDDSESPRPNEASLNAGPGGAAGGGERESGEMASGARADRSSSFSKRLPPINTSGPTSPLSETGAQTARSDSSFPKVRI